MKDDLALREKIQEGITKIESPKDIFAFFKLLNYPDEVLFDVSAKRKKGTFDFKKEDAERIKEIYSILSFENKVTHKRDKLPTFLLEVSTIDNKSFLRNVAKTFDDSGHFPCLLMFTVNYSKMLFVFPTKEKIEVGKHKLRITILEIDKEDILDKKEYYTVIETLSNLYYDGGDWRDVLNKWVKAFNVGRVTNSFFKDYKRVFFTLRDELIKQKIPRKESHEFTLQFLNRVMFIYFVSKKKWLERPRFMDWFWGAYKRQNKFGSNEFYEVWLRQVFFNSIPDFGL